MSVIDLMPQPHLDATDPVSVGVVGATGYTGAQLVTLVHGHPGLRVAWVAGARTAGRRLGDVVPGLEAAPALAGLTVRSLEEGRVPPPLAREADVVALALPHGHAARAAGPLVAAGVRVVDLGADFRLRDPAAYERAYGVPAPPAELQAEAVYALVEAARADLPYAGILACPGCYPTATALAALPLRDLGIGEGSGLVVTGLSGVSGAGRSPGSRNLYCEVAASVAPYGLAGSHRHTPEMEQTLGVPVSFTPHLVPMPRGLLATVVARLPEGLSAGDVAAAVHARYAEAPLVTVLDHAPSTADVVGSATAAVHVAVDPERRTVTAVGAIDNLLKGAASQAIQALNVAFGWPEAAGLPTLARFP